MILLWAKTVLRQVSSGTHDAILGHLAWKVADHTEEVGRKRETETSKVTTANQCRIKRDITAQSETHMQWTDSVQDH